jgi:subtilisin-like proprotein convertase family protein
MLSLAPALAAVPVPTILPLQPGAELEPNGEPGDASPIGNGERVRGSIFPAGDVDYYRFSAKAGDLVYARTATQMLGRNGETQLALLDSDGTTVIETDLGDGPLSSSSIAGATIPTNGTFYLMVTHPSPSGETRPYDLYLQLRSGAPVGETEPNNTAAAADSIAGGYVSGMQSPAGLDFYAMQLNAGDTLFLSLDFDPERDGLGFNGRLGFGVLGEPGNQYRLSVRNQVPSGSPSIAYEITIAKDGTYYAEVNTVDLAEGGPQATYRLSATVLPAARPNCRTYSIAPSAGAIEDGGETVFPIGVPDPAVVERAAVGLDLTHGRLGELTLSLRAPSGHQVSLFQGKGGEKLDSHMRTSFDLYAADSGVATMNPVFLQPPIGDEVNWLNGQQAGGTWSLVARDSAVGETGFVSRIELVLCGPSHPPSPEPLILVEPEPPRLSGLKISPNRFRAVQGKDARRPEARISAGAAPMGATVSYFDSQASLARLTVLARFTGRVGATGKCVRSRRSNSRKASCTRLRRVGSFARRDRVGKNVLRFDGQLEGKVLAPGRYVLVVTARSPTGKASYNKLRKPFAIAP